MKGQIPDSGINEATMNGITLRKKQNRSRCVRRQTVYASISLSRPWYSVQKKILSRVPYHKCVPVQAGLEPEFMLYVSKTKTKTTPKNKPTHLIKTSPLDIRQVLMYIFSRGTHLKYRFQNFLQIQFPETWPHNQKSQNHTRKAATKNMNQQKQQQQQIQTHRSYRYWNYRWFKYEKKV